jgi:hypothetical protein
LADAGKLFRVTPRTVQNWEAGRAMVPYAAFKLMRIMRGYELPGHAWKGWRLVGDTLWTPEGHGFKPEYQRWWSLTCRMAAEFRAMVRKGRPADLLPALKAGPTVAPALATPDPSCIASASAASAADAGLVSFPNKVEIENASSALARVVASSNGITLGPSWGHTAEGGHGRGHGEIQPEAASGDQGRLAGACRPAGAIVEQFDRPVAAEGVGLAQPGCGGEDVPDGGADCGAALVSERALPLREREKVQALPRGVIA